MPAPTLSRPTQNAPAATQTNQNGQQANAAPAAIIPFTRASRQKSRLAGGFTNTTLSASQQVLAPVQLPAAGYIRSVKLQVTGTTSGNSAAVAFQPDAPYSVLQSVSLLAANGDSLIYPLDGFALAMVNKYLCFAEQPPSNDPRLDPGFLQTTGTGATGGSFQFNIRIPFELDSRDALCSLANMAANQSFLLQMSLGTSAQVYSVAPTTPPVVSITAVMEYWSAPADTNGSGNPQATAPPSNGSVSIIQSQTPAIVPGGDQNIQLLNVGNTVRAILLILRTSGGVRTETDWPNVSNWYLNNDPMFYKTKNNWRRQIQQHYGQTAGPAAAPTALAGDNGVYVLSDFIASGSGGDEDAQAVGNRNLWLVTNSATALNFEAANWGGSAGQLQVITHSVRPSDPAAIYQPYVG